MSENPAISVNGGYDKSGFPIGVQIVGRRFDDVGVLGMAKTFESLRGPQRPWPKPAEEIDPCAIRCAVVDARLTRASHRSTNRSDCPGLREDACPRNDVSKISKRQKDNTRGNPNGV